MHGAACRSQHRCRRKTRRIGHHGWSKHPTFYREIGPTIGRPRCGRCCPDKHSGQYWLRLPGLWLHQCRDEHQAVEAGLYRQEVFCPRPQQSSLCA